jgi:hypothetical protein
MEPPTDIFYIELLPPDNQRKVALKLNYDDIINICKSKRKLNTNICQNPYFWRDKIRYDFPDININNIEPQKYRAKYELELANEYDQRNLDIMDKVKERYNREKEKGNVYIKDLTYSELLTKEEEKEYIKIKKKLIFSLKEPERNFP